MYIVNSWNRNLRLFQKSCIFKIIFYYFYFVSSFFDRDNDIVYVVVDIENDVEVDGKV